MNGQEDNFVSGQTVLYRERERGRQERDRKSGQKMKK